jgi:hypothetical protein
VRRKIDRLEPEPATYTVDPTPTLAVTAP